MAKDDEPKMEIERDLVDRSIEFLLEAEKGYCWTFNSVLLYLTSTASDVSRILKFYLKRKGKQIGILKDNGCRLTALPGEGKMLCGYSLTHGDRLDFLVRRICPYMGKGSHIAPETDGLYLRVCEKYSNQQKS